MVGAGDFDGDDRADLLWRNARTGSNTIWKSGDSSTWQAVTSVTDLHWKIVGVGDFNGDGKDDLVDERFDAVVCDFLPPVVNLPERLPCPSILFTHNVEAEIWRRHAENAGNPVSFKVSHELRESERDPKLADLVAVPGDPSRDIAVMVMGDSPWP